MTAPTWQFWSPHLDDVVLSCGRAVAALSPCAVVRVVTVFAGLPRREQVADYDRGCGFRTSRDAVTARRQEDVNALFVLGARPEHLDFLDGQYRDGPPSGLGPAIAKIVDRDGSVVAPLGLRHPDHVAVSDAVLDAAPPHLWLYAEAPAWTLEPEAVADRLAQLRARGWRLERYAMPSSDPDLKRRAVACYRSQTHQLGDPHAYLVRGVYWKAEASW